MENSFDQYHKKDPRSALIHDLRSPINVILMAAEMIERKKEPDHEFIIRHLQKIKENTIKINNLIEGIRNL